MPFHTGLKRFIPPGAWGKFNTQTVRKYCSRSSIFLPDIKKRSCRHRGLNPRRTFCAIIFQLLFQTCHLEVIFKTDSYIRNQLLFHAFYLSDDRVRLKFCEPTVNGLYQSNLVHSFQVQRKIKNVQKSSNLILSCVYRSNISIKWLQEILQQLDGDDYGECAIKIALVAWVGHRAGMQCSLIPLFQYLYCTLL